MTYTNYQRSITIIYLILNIIILVAFFLLPFIGLMDYASVTAASGVFQFGQIGDMGGYAPS